MQYWTIISDAFSKIFTYILHDIDIQELLKNPYVKKEIEQPSLPRSKREARVIPPQFWKPESKYFFRIPDFPKPTMTCSSPGAYGITKIIFLPRLKLNL